MLRATRTLLPILVLLSNATTAAALALAQTEGGEEDTSTMVIMTVTAAPAPPPTSTFTSTATPHPGSTTTTTLPAVTSTAAASPTATPPPKQAISGGLLAAIIVMSVFVIGGLFTMALMSCLQLRRARRREREADVAAQDTRAAVKRRRAAAHLVGVGPRVATPVFFASAAAVAAGEKVGEWAPAVENERRWPGASSRLSMRSDGELEKQKKMMMKDGPLWRESVVEVDDSEMDYSEMDVEEAESASRCASRGRIPRALVTMYELNDNVFSSEVARPA
ncbi:hypothetical protein IWX46DRAFT_642871 [Phyllosticta citricarpa]|uniref:Uncharacterized protein n=1 Tax=Phyllosticta citricarpa TaxID=55181 RepID=A0ABR1LV43_9PEZI